MMIGPPGAGKTMLAQRLATILPALSLEESLETTRIYSAVGLLKKDQALLATRPVRAPHHSASGPALIGGGSSPRPGELSLAHYGILFLDEFVEFPRHVLEMIRQPLEDGFVIVSRARKTIQFPAQFMLVAAMNPCPCGYFGSNLRACKCSPGPDRTVLGQGFGTPGGPDRHPHRRARRGVQQAAVQGPPDRLRKPASDCHGGKGDAVSSVRQRQGPHQRPYESSAVGAILPDRCHGRDDAQRGDDGTGTQRRAHDKICKVARTIADLEGSEDIRSEHVAEAIGYRKLDRKL